MMRADWDMDALRQAPKVYDAGTYGTPSAGADRESQFSGEGVRALFYEGLPWKGAPTRVFAWYGAPDVAPGEKVPAMVLAHGGGGTAFDEWVRIWSRRGYAAISMDLTGTYPGGEPGERPRHEWAGPPHEGASDIGEAPEDQWVYHAVADVLLAHSLLRSFPEVDADRIGLTGISWGGFLTAICAGVDERFLFAVPVYGCGFLNDGPRWQSMWDSIGPEATAEWHALWDPASYVEDVAMPTLWVNGANDSAFPLDIHSRTYLRCGGDRNLSVRVGLHHSHVHGWTPGEIYAFADSLAKGGPGWPRVLEQGREGKRAWVRVHPASAVEHAELVFAADTSDWVECAWQTAPVAADTATGTIAAVLPDGCRAYFFNLVDAEGLISSSVLQVVDEGE
ncbi:MAG: acetylxylan esterase [Candidatus Hydrogenedentes bacterium]|nr:acetylxylan esterase [Candidatus Hydrogenedentota bacterium]